jgi:HSP20 family protein
MKRWQPWEDVRSEMHRLQNEMGRLFDRWGGNSWRPSARTEVPPLNIWDDAECLYVEAELPGLELSDLEILVGGSNQLTIKGERKVPALPQGAWHRQERGYGMFSRTVELPFDVDADKVSAAFRHGVLRVTLPKREEVKTRRIQVQGE